MSSEFDLIGRHFVRPTPQTVLGPGDDCALIAPSPGCELAVTTDMLVSGVHFFPDTDPHDLGWKTLAVSLSDLAAMGATPRWALLAGSLPQADDTWLSAFSAGLMACAGRYGVDLAGGDTTRGPLNLCLTAIGEVPAGTALRRDGAVAGDDLWVSGQPGLAALGLAHAQGELNVPEPLRSRCLHALHHPLPRIELGCTLGTERLAHAAIDISDGLLADVGHIAQRSSCTIEICEQWLPRLPSGVDPLRARQAQLGGGDDYELAFTAAAGQRIALAALAARLDLPLWRIGRVCENPQGCGAAVHLLDENGLILPITERGYDHFDQNQAQ